MRLEQRESSKCGGVADGGVWLATADDTAGYLTGRDMLALPDIRFQSHHNG
jgi:hypothetical protein